MTQYTRKVALVWSPKVEVFSQTQTIRLITGSWKGQTRYECQGDLHLHCAVHLVRELRRAIRKIRDDETAKLAEAVANAEGNL